MKSDSLNAALWAVLAWPERIPCSLPEERMDFGPAALFTTHKKDYEAHDEKNGKRNQPPALMLISEEKK